VWRRTQQRSLHALDSSRIDKRDKVAIWAASLGKAGRGMNKMSDGQSRDRVFGRV